MSRRLFYQGKRLHSEINPNFFRSLLHGSDSAYAERRIIDNTSECTLLAIDGAHSVIQTHHVGLPKQITYSPYGFHSAESRAHSMLAFNGEWQEPVTNYYPLGNGHRLFSPTLGRFLSPDRTSPFGIGGLNSYAYCIGDPINLADPSGQSGRFNRPTQGRPQLASQRVLQRAIQRARRAGGHGASYSRALPTAANQNRQSPQAQVPAAGLQPGAVAQDANQPAAVFDTPAQVTLLDRMEELVKATVDVQAGARKGHNHPLSPDFPQWTRAAGRMKALLSENNQPLAEHLPAYLDQFRHSVLRAVDGTQERIMRIRMDE